MTIRRARREDQPHVVGIIRSSASWYRPFVAAEDLGEHEVDEAWARENFARREFFVGHVDGAVVATVTLQDAGDFSYLGYVYVHAEHTGKGLGRDLLDFARDESRDRGDKGMVLIAHPEADWACKTYERYGFDVIAEREDKILAWNNGFLRPYYEKGFQLYRYLHVRAS